MVVREGKEYILKTKDGKRVLGRHDTLASALAQETAINIAKARRAGHRIPRRKK